MTDPTRSDPLAEERGPRFRIGHPVLDATQTYAGQFAALRGNLAAAGQGFAAPLSAAVGVIPLGAPFSDEVLGDASATPPPENNADLSGRILKRQVVTGVVDNPTDLGKVVFLADSGAPFVLADPGNTLPSGVILDVTGTAEADIWLFGAEALFIFGILSRTLYGASAWASWGTDVGNP